MPSKMQGGKWYGPDEPVPPPPSSYKNYEQHGHTEIWHNGTNARAYTWHYNNQLGKHGWLVQNLKTSSCCGR